MKILLQSLVVLGLAWSATSAASASSEGATSADDFRRLQDVLSDAKEIDRLVEERLEAKDTRAHSFVDDETFVRRAYITLVGRIPSLEETRAFLKSSGNKARQELIDELLGRPGYVSQMFNYWSDILRVKNRLARRVSGEPYMDWIKQSLLENKPYDRFVTEMITAEGAAHARDNGATGYFLRDLGMPLDNMSNTVRVFLGTRLECAQCHDHPFDRWTQKEFFEMAAFTGDMQFRDNSLEQTEEGAALRDIGRSLRGNRNGQRAYRRMIQTLQAGLSGSGSGLIKLPEDYQYSDARPGQIIRAQTLFGEETSLEVDIPKERRNKKRPRNRPRRRNRGPKFPEVDSREAFATWMTDAENPRFTTVIANRMWKKVMGHGLIEPVDDMRDDSVASDPALMAHLESLMIELGYDLREFQRVLCHTKTFRREAMTRLPHEEKDVCFPGPLMRRMTAEQVWDSMLTFIVEDPDHDLLEPGAKAEVVYANYESSLNRSNEEWQERIALQTLRYTDPQKYREERRRKAQRERERRIADNADKRRENGPLLRKLRKARREGNTKAERRILAEIEARGMDPRDFTGRRRSTSTWARASDLPMPAPAGHFLREFGQSDRDQIEDSHEDATVPQALALMNGIVDREILGRRGSPLMADIEEVRRDRDKIEVAYLSILNREPTSREVAMWKKDFEDDPKRGQDDMVWTLINSHEFLFLR